MMENLLNNIYALIATGFAVLCTASYIVSKVVKKKKKVKELLNSLGITRKDVDAETYKYITSKEYAKCLNYAFDEGVEDYE